MSRYAFLLGGLFAMLMGNVSIPDVIRYRLPTEPPLFITLQGTARYVTGNTVTFRHPTFGNLNMNAQDVTITKVPSLARRFRKKKAEAGEDVNDLFELSSWCLRYGKIKEFYATVDQILEVDPSNRRALNIQRVRKMMARPIPSADREQAYLQKLVGRDGMRFVRSQHFLLYHDTGEGVGTSGRRKTRAQQRLELLERVYESFLLKFYSRGIRLRVPQRLLMVVLFKDHDDFLAFSSKLGPDMASVAGFWHTRTNVAVFYDQGESPRFAAVRRLENQFQEMRRKAIRNRSPATKNIVRTADSLRLILQMAREDADIEVVTHEATHQLAGNTGLLPRNIMIPQWIHEGLASYFESPEDASWSGVGAVNEDRLAYYRQLARDQEHSSIEFIVGDQIFKFAASHRSVLHGYGQAWALTHFLIERHFNVYMRFCQRLGEMPPDILLSPTLLTKLFEEVCDKPLDELNVEWKSYMRELKTDLDKVMAEEELN